MIIIDGEEFPTHKEYFEKYPWRYHANKRINRPLLLEAHSRPCTDCGIKWHPLVMTLDHTDRSTGYHTSEGKRKYPADMVTYPPETFKAELAKCEPVCWNCHQMREFLRDGRDKERTWKPWSGLLLRGAILK